jgi:hypothetical protein
MILLKTAHCLPDVANLSQCSMQNPLQTLGLGDSHRYKPAQVEAFVLTFRGSHIPQPA